MPAYNKLVRDRIPEIIEESGKQCATWVLDQKDYSQALIHKLQEEIDEYIKVDSREDAIEELADVLEVMHALAIMHGTSIEDVEQIRKTKAEERGGFAKRIFLEEVYDD